MYPIVRGDGRSIAGPRSLSALLDRCVDSVPLAGVKQSIAQVLGLPADARVTSITLRRHESLDKQIRNHTWNHGWGRIDWLFVLTVQPLDAFTIARLIEDYQLQEKVKFAFALLERQSSDWIIHSLRCKGHPVAEMSFMFAFGESLVSVPSAITIVKAIEILGSLGDRRGVRTMDKLAVIARASALSSRDNPQIREVVQSHDIAACVLWLDDMFDSRKITNQEVASIKARCEEKIRSLAPQSIWPQSVDNEVPVESQGFWNDSQTTQLLWELLPPSWQDDEQLRSYLGIEESQATHDSYRGERLAFLESLKPRRRFRGADFGRTIYYVAEYQRVAIADAPEWGNALYYVDNARYDWRSVFRSTRQVAVYSGARRIVHSGEWKDRVRALVI